MATLHFELVSPERVLFSGEVEAVMLPGTEGDMTVLPGHAPVMTALKTGVVIATNHKDNGERVLVRGGFAEVNAGGVTVLAERDPGPGPHGRDDRPRDPASRDGARRDRGFRGPAGGRRGHRATARGAGRPTVLRRPGRGLAAPRGWAKGLRLSS